MHSAVKTILDSLIAHTHRRQQKLKLSSRSKSLSQKHGSLVEAHLFCPLEPRYTLALLTGGSPQSQSTNLCLSLQSICSLRQT